MIYTSQQVPPPTQQDIYNILDIKPVNPLVSHIVLFILIVGPLMLITISVWLWFRQSKEYRLKEMDKAGIYLNYLYLVLGIVLAVTYIGDYFHNKIAVSKSVAIGNAVALIIFWFLYWKQKRNIKGKSTGLMLAAMIILSVISTTTILLYFLRS